MDLRMTTSPIPDVSVPPPGPPPPHTIVAEAISVPSALLAAPSVAAADSVRSPRHFAADESNVDSKAEHTHQNDGRVSAGASPSKQATHSDRAAPSPTTSTAPVPLWEQSPTKNRPININADAAAHGGVAATAAAPFLVENADGEAVHVRGWARGLSKASIELLLAIEENAPARVTAALENGADCNVCRPDRMGQSALHLAARLPEPDCISALLDGVSRTTTSATATATATPGAAAALADPALTSSSHGAATNQGSQSSRRVAGAEPGAEPGARTSDLEVDGNGGSAPEEEGEGLAEERVRPLLLTDDDGRTALHVAASHSDSNLLLPLLLLAYGLPSTVDRRRFTVLHCLADNRKATLRTVINLFEWTLRQFSPEASDMLNFAAPGKPHRVSVLDVAIARTATTTDPTQLANLHSVLMLHGGRKGHALQTGERGQLGALERQQRLQVIMAEQLAAEALQQWHIRRLAAHKRWEQHKRRAARISDKEATARVDVLRLESDAKAALLYFIETQRVELLKSEHAKLEDQSALVIQRGWRTTLAKREAIRRREFLAKRGWALLSAQRVCRGFAGRRSVHRWAKGIAAVVRLQRQFRQRVLLRAFLKHCGEQWRERLSAAREILFCFRRAKVREKVKARVVAREGPIREWIDDTNVEFEKNVTRIQSHWRMRRCQSQYKKLRTGCIRTQTEWRRHLARRRTCDLRMKRRAADMLKRTLERARTMALVRSYVSKMLQKKVRLRIETMTRAMTTVVWREAFMSFLLRNRRNFASVFYTAPRVVLEPWRNHIHAVLGFVAMLLCLAALGTHCIIRRTTATPMWNLFDVVVIVLLWIRVLVCVTVVPARLSGHLYDGAVLLGASVALAMQFYPLVPVYGLLLLRIPLTFAPYVPAVDHTARAVRLTVDILAQWAPIVLFVVIGCARSIAPEGDLLTGSGHIGNSVLRVLTYGAHDALNALSVHNRPLPRNSTTPATLPTPTPNIPQLDPQPLTASHPGGVVTSYNLTPTGNSDASPPGFPQLADKMTAQVGTAIPAVANASGTGGGGGGDFYANAKSDSAASGGISIVVTPAPFVPPLMDASIGHLWVQVIASFFARIVVFFACLSSTVTAVHHVFRRHHSKHARRLAVAALTPVYGTFDEVRRTDHGAAGSSLSSFSDGVSYQSMHLRRARAVRGLNKNSAFQREMYEKEAVFAVADSIDARATHAAHTQQFMNALHQQQGAANFYPHQQSHLHHQGGGQHGQDHTYGAGGGEWCDSSDAALQYGQNLGAPSGPAGSSFSGFSRDLPPPPPPQFTHGGPANTGAANANANGAVDSDSMTLPGVVSSPHPSLAPSNTSVLLPPPNVHHSTAIGGGGGGGVSSYSHHGGGGPSHGPSAAESAQMARSAFDQAMLGIPSDSAHPGPPSASNFSTAFASSTSPSSQRVQNSQSPFLQVPPGGPNMGSQSGSTNPSLTPLSRGGNSFTGRSAAAMDAQRLVVRASTPGNIGTRGDAFGAGAGVSPSSATQPPFIDSAERQQRLQLLLYQQQQRRRRQHRRLARAIGATGVSDHSHDGRYGANAGTNGLGLGDDEDDDGVDYTDRGLAIFGVTLLGETRGKMKAGMRTSTGLRASQIDPDSLQFSPRPHGRSGAPSSMDVQRRGGRRSRLDNARENAPSVPENPKSFKDRLAALFNRRTTTTVQTFEQPPPSAPRNRTGSITLPHHQQVPTANQQQNAQQRNERNHPMSEQEMRTYGNTVNEDHVWPPSDSDDDDESASSGDDDATERRRQEALHSFALSAATDCVISHAARRLTDAQTTGFHIANSAMNGNDRFKSDSTCSGATARFPNEPRRSEADALDGHGRGEELKGRSGSRDTPHVLSDGLIRIVDRYDAGSEHPHRQIAAEHRAVRASLLTAGHRLGARPLPRRPLCERSLLEQWQAFVEWEWSGPALLKANHLLLLMYFAAKFVFVDNSAFEYTMGVLFCLEIIGTGIACPYLFTGNSGTVNGSASISGTFADTIQLCARVALASLSFIPATRSGYVFLRWIRFFEGVTHHTAIIDVHIVSLAITAFATLSLWLVAVAAVTQTTGISVEVCDDVRSCFYQATWRLFAPNQLKPTAPLLAIAHALLLYAVVPLMVAIMAQMMLLTAGGDIALTRCVAESIRANTHRFMQHVTECEPWFAARRLGHPRSDNIHPNGSSNGLHQPTHNGVHNDGVHNKGATALQMPPLVGGGGSGGAGGGAQGGRPGHTRQRSGSLSNPRPGDINRRRSLTMPPRKESAGPGTGYVTTNPSGYGAYPAMSSAAGFDADARGGHPPHVASSNAAGGVSGAGGSGTGGGVCRFSLISAGGPETWYPVRHQRRSRSAGVVGGATSVNPMMTGGSAAPTFASTLFESTAFVQRSLRAIPRSFGDVTAANVALIPPRLVVAAREWLGRARRRLRLRDVVAMKKLPPAARIAAHKAAHRPAPGRGIFANRAAHSPAQSAVGVKGNVTPPPALSRNDQKTNARETDTTSARNGAHGGGNDGNGTRPTMLPRFQVPSSSGVDGQGGLDSGSKAKLPGFLQRPSHILSVSPDPVVANALPLRTDDALAVHLLTRSGPTWIYTTRFLRSRVLHWASVVVSAASIALAFLPCFVHTGGPNDSIASLAIVDGSTMGYIATAVHVISIGFGLVVLPRNSTALFTMISAACLIIGAVRAEWRYVQCVSLLRALTWHVLAPRAAMRTVTRAAAAGLRTLAPCVALSAGACCAIALFWEDQIWTKMEVEAPRLWGAGTAYLMPLACGFCFVYASWSHPDRSASAAASAARCLPFLCRPSEIATGRAGWWGHAAALAVLALNLVAVCVVDSVYWSPFRIIDTACLFIFVFHALWSLYTHAGVPRLFLSSSSTTGGAGVSAIGAGSSAFGGDDDATPGKGIGHALPYTSSASAMILAAAQCFAANINAENAAENGAPEPDKKSGDNDVKKDHRSPASSPRSNDPNSLSIQDRQGDGRHPDDTKDSKAESSNAAKEGSNVTSARDRRRSLSAAATDAAASSAAAAAVMPGRSGHSSANVAMQDSFAGYGHAPAFNDLGNSPIAKSEQINGESQRNGAQPKIPGNSGNTQRQLSVNGSGGGGGGRSAAMFDTDKLVLPEHAHVDTVALQVRNARTILLTVDLLLCLWMFTVAIVVGLLEIGPMVVYTATFSIRFVRVVHFTRREISMFFVTNSALFIGGFITIVFFVFAVASMVAESSGRVTWEETSLRVAGFLLGAMGSGDVPADVTGSETDNAVALAAAVVGKGLLAALFGLLLRRFVPCWSLRNEGLANRAQALYEFMTAASERPKPLKLLLPSSKRRALLQGHWTDDVAKHRSNTAITNAPSQSSSSGAGKDKTAAANAASGGRSSMVGSSGTLSRIGGLDRDSSLGRSVTSAGSAARPDSSKHPHNTNPPAGSTSGSPVRVGDSGATHHRYGSAGSGSDNGSPVRVNIPDESSGGGGKSADGGSPNAANQQRGRFMSSSFLPQLSRSGTDITSPQRGGGGGAAAHPDTHSSGPRENDGTENDLQNGTAGAMDMNLSNDLTNGEEPTAEKVKPARRPMALKACDWPSLAGSDHICRWQVPFLLEGLKLVHVGLQRNLYAALLDLAVFLEIREARESAVSEYYAVVSAMAAGGPEVSVGNDALPGFPIFDPLHASGLLRQQRRQRRLLLAKAQAKAQAKAAAAAAKAEADAQRAAIRAEKAQAHAAAGGGKSADRSVSRERRQSQQAQQQQPRGRPPPAPPSPLSAIQRARSMSTSSNSTAGAPGRDPVDPHHPQQPRRRSQGLHASAAALRRQGLGRGSGSPVSRGRGGSPVAAAGGRGGSPLAAGDSLRRRSLSAEGSGKFAASTSGRAAVLSPTTPSSKSGRPPLGNPRAVPAPAVASSGSVNSPMAAQGGGQAAASPRAQSAPPTSARSQETAGAPSQTRRATSESKTEKPTPSSSKTQHGATEKHQRAGHPAPTTTQEDKKRSDESDADAFGLDFGFDETAPCAMPFADRVAFAALEAALAPAPTVSTMRLVQALHVIDSGCPVASVHDAHVWQAFWIAHRRRRAATLFQSAWRMYRCSMQFRKTRPRQDTVASQFLRGQMRRAQAAKRVQFCQNPTLGAALNSAPLIFNFSSLHVDFCSRIMERFEELTRVEVAPLPTFEFHHDEANAPLLFISHLDLTAGVAGLDGGVAASLQGPLVRTDGAAGSGRYGPDGTGMGMAGAALSGDGPLSKSSNIAGSRLGVDGSPLFSDGGAPSPVRGDIDGLGGTQRLITTGAGARAIGMQLEESSSGDDGGGGGGVGGGLGSLGAAGGVGSGSVGAGMLTHSFGSGALHAVPTNASHGFGPEGSGLVAPIEPYEDATMPPFRAPSFGAHPGTLLGTAPLPPAMGGDSHTGTGSVSPRLYPPSARGGPPSSRAAGGLISSVGHLTAPLGAGGGGGGGGGGGAGAYGGSFHSAAAASGAAAGGASVGGASLGAAPPPGARLLRRPSPLVLDDRGGGGGAGSSLAVPQEQSGWGRPGGLSPPGRGYGGGGHRRQQSGGVESDLNGGDSESMQPIVGVRDSRTLAEIIAAPRITTPSPAAGNAAAVGRPFPPTPGSAPARQAAAAAAPFHARQRPGETPVLAALEMAESSPSEA